MLDGIDIYVIGIKKQCGRLWFLGFFFAFFRLGMVARRNTFLGGSYAWAHHTCNVLCCRRIIRGSRFISFGKMIGFAFQCAVCSLCLAFSHIFFFLNEILDVLLLQNSSTETKWDNPAATAPNNIVFEWCHIRITVNTIFIMIWLLFSESRLRRSLKQQQQKTASERKKEEQLQRHLLYLLPNSSPSDDAFIARHNFWEKA